MLLNQILFYIIILLSNIIQGITGFAGTILAMPFGLMLVGFDTAKPVLNVLGLLAGISVFVTHGKYINKKELRKIIVVMAPGILAGILLKSFFTGREQLLYRLLGVFILVISVQGYLLQRRGGQSVNDSRREGKDSSISYRNRNKKGRLKSFFWLAGAGIAHGMFVSGGPLLIGYLSGEIRDKTSFRATISTVWIILNTIILLDDIRAGLWTCRLVKIQAVSLPFLAAGMMIGARLYRTMSQQLFMKLTYLLLFISGISLLVK